MTDAERIAAVREAIAKKLYEYAQRLYGAKEGLHKHEPISWEPRSEKTKKRFYQEADAHIAFLASLGLVLAVEGDGYVSGQPYDDTLIMVGDETLREAGYTRTVRLK